MNTTDQITLTRYEIRNVLSVGIRTENETKQSALIRRILANDAKAAKAREDLESAIIDAVKRLRKEQSA